MYPRKGAVYNYDRRTAASMAPLSEIKRLLDEYQKQYQVVWNALQGVRGHVAKVLQEASKLNKIHKLLERREVYVEDDFYLDTLREDLHMMPRLKKLDPRHYQDLLDDYEQYLEDVRTGR